MSKSASKLKERFETGAFSQQELWAWQPLLTPVAVSGILLLVSIIFIPIGLVLLEASERNVYQKVRFDNVEGCSVSDKDTVDTLPKLCTFQFTVDHDMKAPIFFYYEIHNFYQNHRVYLDSKSDSQLRDTGNDQNYRCKPIKKWQSDMIYPCGFQARAFYSDRFRMSVNDDDLCNTTSKCHFYGTGSTHENEWRSSWSNWHDEPNWSRKDIAFSSDFDEKFIARKLNNKSETNRGEWQIHQGLDLPVVDDPDFVVWMRAAALPKFRKLHRILRKQNLKEGDVVNITAALWFPTKEFDGEKYIAIGTTTWAGLENNSLAWCLISVSIICILIAIIIAILLLFGTRKLAEVDQFKWHNKPSSGTSLLQVAYS